MPSIGFNFCGWGSGAEVALPKLFFLRWNAHCLCVGTFPAALSQLDWPLFPNLYRTPFAERYPQFGLVVPHFGLLASEARRSVSEACRKRVGSASKPRRNRVGTASELTESEPSRNRVGRCWPQNGPPYMLINRWPVLCRDLVVLSGLRNGEPDGMPDSFSSPAQTSAVTNGATLLRSLLAPRPVWHRPMHK